MNKQKIASQLNRIGNLFVITAFVFAFFTFGPAVKQEIKYQTKGTLGKSEVDLTPPNTDFSIVIPKIEAVAPVFGNTDPYNKANYLPVLQRGVAHASGTAYPGNPGNTYLFAHSTDAFYNVGRYNAVFYLLGKLEKGDEIEIYYNNEKILYIVREVKTVSADAVEYLDNLGGKTLTLQTCYPPGTTLRRLIVIADQAEES